MKQIHKAVQALESDNKIWAATLDFVEEAEKAEKNLQGKFPRANMHMQIFRNNPSKVVWLYYQILMMAKMSKTEISAKILKRKKNYSFYYRNHTKSFSAHSQSKVFPLNQT